MIEKCRKISSNDSNYTDILETIKKEEEYAEKQGIHFGINSLSCASADISDKKSILWPPSATDKTLERVEKFKKEVFEKYDFNNNGVSLHGGHETIIKRFAEKAKERNLRITSGDLPDVNWFDAKHVWQVVRDLFGDAIKMNFDRTKEHVGWRINSTGTYEFPLPIPHYKSWKEKIVELEENVASVDPKKSQKKIIRANAKEIKTGKVKDIFRYLTENVIVCFEYSTEAYSVQEYLNVMRKLKKEYGEKVGLSFDGGHAQLAYNGEGVYKNDKTLSLPGSPVDQFETIVNDQDLSQMLSMIEINQCDEDIHEELDKGDVDYKKIMEIYGKNYRMRSGGVKSMRQPHIVIESSPKVYDATLKNGGKYLSKLNEAFWS